MAIAGKGKEGERDKQNKILFMVNATGILVKAVGIIRIQICKEKSLKFHKQVTNH